MAARTCSTSSGGTLASPWSAPACAPTWESTVSSSGPVNVVVQPGTTSPQAKAFMWAPCSVGCPPDGDQGAATGGGCTAPGGSGGGGRGGEVLDPQDPQDVALAVG